jgi:CRISPR-associated endonuclease/helicase Cas3
MKPGDTAGFRHEVASALAFLREEHSAASVDLAAFLIMAHHGKVRTMPVPWDDEEPTDLCGVRDGDRIGSGTPVGAGTGLGLGRLRPGLDHPGWQGRVADLLRTRGPFVLAYLEALVAISDWRAS